MVEKYRNDQEIIFELQSFKADNDFFIEMCFRKSLYINELVCF